MKRYDPLKEPPAKEWLSLDEQERIDLAVGYHRRAKVRLPNVRVHAIAHVVVENQIALGDEIPARPTVQRLMSEGLDRHDAIHAVGSVLMESLWQLLAHPEAAPNVDINSAYVAGLKRLTAAKWLRSGLREEDATTEANFDLEEMLDELETEEDEDAAVVETDVDDVDEASATAQSNPVSWKELLNAYELADFGEPGSHAAFFNKKSGEFVYRSEMYPDEDDVLPEDIDENEDYIRLPDKRELDLGKHLALSFVDEYLPDDFRRVKDIFSRRGAYARFKDLLDHRKALNQWYGYERKATEKALRQWCADNKIAVTDGPDIAEPCSEPEED
jgi:hypothetical protein